MSRITEAARERAAKHVADIPTGTLYTKLSREGVATLTASCFEAGARWAFEQAAKLVDAKSERPGGFINVLAHNLAIEIRALADEDSP